MLDKLKNLSKIINDMKKLKWKKIYCDDLSGYWYETKITPLKWNFILDNNSSENVWRIFLNVNGNCDETQITTRTFKNVEKAQEFVENYITKIYSDLKKFLS